MKFEKIKDFKPPNKKNLPHRELHNPWENLSWVFGDDEHNGPSQLVKYMTQEEIHDALAKMEERGAPLYWVGIDRNRWIDVFNLELQCRGLI